MLAAMPADPPAGRSERVKSLACEPCEPFDEAGPAFGPGGHAVASVAVAVALSRQRGPLAGLLPSQAFVAEEAAPRATLTAEEGLGV
jgi:hypothetical protein